RSTGRTLDSARCPGTREVCALPGLSRRGRAVGDDEDTRALAGTSRARRRRTRDGALPAPGGAPGRGRPAQAGRAARGVRARSGPLRAERRADSRGERPAWPQGRGGPALVCAGGGRLADLELAPLGRRKLSSVGKWLG